MKRKGYNPFKMWGSYAGAVITSVVTFGLSMGSVNSPFNSFMNNLFYSITNATIDTFAYYNQIWRISIWIIIPILGFFVGWGVHSLVRWVKNVF